MTPLLGSLLAVGGILLFLAASGSPAALSILPGRVYRLERAGWSFGLGLGLLALSVLLAFAAGARPGWLPLILTAIAIGALARPWRTSFSDPAPGRAGRISKPALLWILPLAAGIAVYFLRSVSEPIVSNDFLANWGLKGRTIFAEGRIPERLFSAEELAFSHPEYPLGIPLVYAGVASLLGRWDDHALGLLFPAFQIATVLVLVGWLRRRGASPASALAAGALLSLFAPLYSPSTIGYADVPLSFFALLLATSLSDAVDTTDARALQRTACAALLCTATKNEGLYLVAAAIAIGVAGLKRRRLPVAPLVAALLLPAAAVVIVQRLAWGSPPLSDYDFGFLRPALWLALGSRIAITARLVGQELLAPGVAAVLALLAGLFVAGRRTPWAERALVLALCAECAYLVLPVFAVYPGTPEVGPIWIVMTSLGRTTSALAPLVAAGLAGRLRTDAH